MTLYDDEVLVDTKFAWTGTTATVNVMAWHINHSWTDWAIQINEELIIN